jgi:N-acetylmuramoyl-L-alanine amidase
VPQWMTKPQTRRRVFAVTVTVAAVSAVSAVSPLSALGLLMPGLGQATGSKAVARATLAAAARPTSLHPIVASSDDPVTGGYWLVASDGGVFNFGAPFYGSAGALTLSKPIVGMAATPGGGGYWLVASDGGVFSFGDARFFGSTGAIALNRPVVGMAATPDGGGYRLVASDGGVFSFGDAAFAGAATGSLQRGAVAITSSAGPGYRIMSADGGVYAFGGADFYGSVYVPPMAGEVIAIDPGHDGGNGSAPAFISQPIANGSGIESCDTVGTETGAGYTEHAFNFDVATRLEAILQAEGATVVLTRPNDTGVGPCVNQRAAIGNAAAADAAISIHADGGPVSGRGFDVIAPAPVVSSFSNNTAVVPASLQLAADVRNAFGADTAEPVSDYSGTNGIDQRSDLGGLNLTTVPKVLIECANMQNPTDAGLTESAAWRQQAAQGLADGIGAFLQAQETP